VIDIVAWCISCRGVARNAQLTRVVCSTISISHVAVIEFVDVLYLLLLKIVCVVMRHNKLLSVLTAIFVFVVFDAAVYMHYLHFLQLLLCLLCSICSSFRRSRAICIKSIRRLEE
jgi:hypothetical protein